ncbi:hypothetical protein [Acetobacter aceti]|uniref:Uncharacterized protein n=1 Tax=Acetobacter aceti TaxID=435 RepID=A0A6S6PGV4_ACEAC|nr:hypothetical protein [Acetobacter aceti]BCI65865.1 hypothetical protein AAJCM20276_04890 [Acetobacter aceti]
MARLQFEDKVRSKIEFEDKTRGKLKNVDLSDKLGASSVSNISNEDNPLSGYFLRKELVERLCSSGGRPSLRGMNVRHKIPIAEKDWEKLLNIAKSFSDQKIKPSPVHIASIILNDALEKIDDSGNLAGEICLGF